MKNYCPKCRKFWVERLAIHELGSAQVIRPQRWDPPVHCPTCGTGLVEPPPSFIGPTKAPTQQGVDGAVMRPPTNRHPDVEGVMNRPTWDEFFLQMARLTATMGTCPRKQVGAVIVKGKDVLTIGFNGAPAGHPHCTEVGCLQIPGEGEGCHRTRHAEENAMLKAVARGLDMRDATIYLTLSPCMACAKRMVTEGIKRVVFLEHYRSMSPVDFLKRAGIKVEQIVAQIHDSVVVEEKAGN